MTQLKKLHLDLKELGFEGEAQVLMLAFSWKWEADRTDWGNSASKRTPLNDVSAMMMRLTKLLTYDPLTLVYDNKLFEDATLLYPT